MFVDFHRIALATEQPLNGSDYVTNEYYSCYFIENARDLKDPRFGSLCRFPYFCWYMAI